MLEFENVGVVPVPQFIKCNITLQNFDFPVVVSHVALKRIVPLYDAQRMSKNQKTVR